MKTALPLHLTALALIGCSTTQPQLAQGLAKAARCIDLNQVVGRRAAGPDSVEFELANGTVYRSRIVGQCPGLARLGASATVSVASGGEGGRLCTGDRIRVFDPLEVRAVSSRSQPTCTLGEWREMAHAG